MAVRAASAKVGAGQPHKAQPRAVCTAADGHAARLQAVLADGCLRALDHIHMLLYHLAHVAVGIAQRQLHRARAVAGIQEIRHKLHSTLLLFQLGCVMIAQDIARLGIFLIAMDGGQVVEALVALGIFRLFLHRQHGVKLHGDACGVLHAVLGGAGMDVAPMHRHLGRCGVEVFIFQLVDFAAIHSIGKVRAEGGHVKQIRAAADFLIGRKADADFAMADAAVLQHVLAQRHDFGHASLIVRPQHSGAVGDDQVLAAALRKLRKVLFAQHNALFGVQADIAALILHHAGMKIAAGRRVHRIHMGNQADGGRVLTIGGDFAIHIGMRIQADIGHPHRAHFVSQQPGQLPFAGRRRAALTVFIAGCIDLYIAQKPFL